MSRIFISTFFLQVNGRVVRRHQGSLGQLESTQSFAARFRGKGKGENPCLVQFIKLRTTNRNALTGKT
jgi:hypothetical protein